MTKRKWEGNDALEIEPVDEGLNRPTVTIRRPTVGQDISTPAAQTAAEGGIPNWAEVATLATLAVCQEGSPSWTGVSTAIPAATKEGELRVGTQVATAATSAIFGDTSPTQDEVDDVATSAAKEGEYGPFWALLANAGYVIWDQ